MEEAGRPQSFRPTSEFVRASKQLVRRISALRAWNREGKSEENRAEEKEAEIDWNTRRRQLWDLQIEIPALDPHVFGAGSVPREAMTTEKEGDQTSSPFALLSSLCTSVDESGDTDRCFLETFYALWPLEFLCSLVRSVSPEVFSQGSFNCDAVEKEKRHCDAVEKEKRNCDAVEKEKRNCDAVEKEKRQRLWESLARLPFHPSLIFFGRADCLDSEAHTATQKMYFESVAHFCFCSEEGKSKAAGADTKRCEGPETTGRLGEQSSSSLEKERQQRPGDGKGAEEGETGGGVKENEELKQKTKERDDALQAVISAALPAAPVVPPSVPPSLFLPTGRDGRDSSNRVKEGIEGGGGKGDRIGPGEALTPGAVSLSLRGAIFPPLPPPRVEFELQVCEENTPKHFFAVDEGGSGPGESEQTSWGEGEEERKEGTGRGREVGDGGGGSAQDLLSSLPPALATRLFPASHPAEPPAASEGLRLHEKTNKDETEEAAASKGKEASTEEAADRRRRSRALVSTCSSSTEQPKEERETQPIRSAFDLLTRLQSVGEAKSTVSGQRAGGDLQHRGSGSTEQALGQKEKGIDSDSVPHRRSRTPLPPSSPGSSSIFSSRTNRGGSRGGNFSRSSSPPGPTEQGHPSPLIGRPPSPSSFGPSASPSSSGWKTSSGPSALPSHSPLPPPAVFSKEEDFIPIPPIPSPPQHPSLFGQPDPPAGGVGTSPLFRSPAGVGRPSSPSSSSLEGGLFLSTSASIHNREEREKDKEKQRGLQLAGLSLSLSEHTALTPERQRDASPPSWPHQQPHQTPTTTCQAAAALPMTGGRPPSGTASRLSSQLNTPRGGSFPSPFPPQSLQPLQPPYSPPRQQERERERGWPKTNPTSGHLGTPAAPLLTGAGLIDMLSASNAQKHPVGAEQDSANTTEGKEREQSNKEKPEEDAATTSKGLKEEEAKKEKGLFLHRSERDMNRNLEKDGGSQDKETETDTPRVPVSPALSPLQVYRRDPKTPFGPVSITSQPPQSDPDRVFHPSSLSPSDKPTSQADVSPSSTSKEGDAPLTLPDPETHTRTEGRGHTPFTNEKVRGKGFFSAAARQHFEEEENRDTPVGAGQEAIIQTDAPGHEEEVKTKQLNAVSEREKEGTKGRSQIIRGEDYEPDTVSSAADKSQQRHSEEIPRPDRDRGREGGKANFRRGSSQASGPLRFLNTLLAPFSLFESPSPPQTGLTSSTSDCCQVSAAAPPCDLTGRTQKSFTAVGVRQYRQTTETRSKQHAPSYPSAYNSSSKLTLAPDGQSRNTTQRTQAAGRGGDRGTHSADPQVADSSSTSARQGGRMREGTRASTSTTTHASVSDPPAPSPLPLPLREESEWRFPRRKLHARGLRSNLLSPPTSADAIATGHEQPSPSSRGPISVSATLKISGAGMNPTGAVTGLGLGTSSVTSSNQIRRLARRGALRERERERERFAQGSASVSVSVASAGGVSINPSVSLRSVSRSSRPDQSPAVKTDTKVKDASEGHASGQTGENRLFSEASTKVEATTKATA